MIDTLVLFYHPAQPGLHKRLRAEYKHPPAYVEASHPVAALLDEEQTGWSVAALGYAPVSKTVYYWEEVLRKARSPRDVYTLAPQAYAKRLDLYIPPRLAKKVEIAAIPATEEEAGWKFHSTPGARLLHLLYHAYTWLETLELRRGHLRVYLEYSLAPPHYAQQLETTAYAVALALAAQGATVEYAVYAAPRPPSHTRKTPIVELERVKAELIEGPRDALRRAALEIVALYPPSTSIRATPPAKPPKDLQRRLSRLTAKTLAVAAGVLVAATWAAAAVAKTEAKPLATTTRILSELIAADIETAVLQKYQEGGLLAHRLDPDTRSLTMLAYTVALLQPLSRIETEKLETLPNLALQSPTPSAKPASLLARLLLEEGFPAEPVECTSSAAEEAAERLAIHPAVIRVKGGRIESIDAQCAEEALKKLLKA